MPIETQHGRMPMWQLNAHVDDGLLIRGGIPHSGGKLAFHAFERGFAGMVSASAFWNPKTGRFRIPQASDLTEIDFALDSAGFTAMKLFQSKGRQPGIAGIYPWTMEQFVELASFSGAAWGLAARYVLRARASGGPAGDRLQGECDGNAA
ncbi:hypothetical protein VSR34_29750 [Paraburkholderia sp. JHI2823]|uniref:hypothetical protein n=1 Tax=Paraburkholderia sp. JHI2823 TaxID=3112960 RepID=UPI003175801C